MRIEVLIGGICAAGLALTAVACGSSESSTTPDGDGSGGETNASSSGGSSSGKPSTSSSSGGSSGTSSSGGSSGSTSSGGLQATELAKGFSSIIGIAGDQVIFQGIDQAGVTLNAVPLAGGAATKITDMADTDRAVVRGGAVGIWKTVASGLGTFNVWTKAAGLKAGPAASLVGLFAATDDGSRIAVSVAATANSSRFAVLDPATLTAATTFNGGDNAAANIAQSCIPTLAFAGKTFVSAYCTTGSTVRARLVVMGDAATTFDSVVSNASNAAAIQPYFQLNKNNTKVLVLGLPDTETGVTSDEQLRIVTLPGGATQVIDTDVYDGFLTDDGSEVLYQTGAGALKRASTGATPNPTAVVAAPAIKSMIGFTSDWSRILFGSSDPDPQTDALDLKAATTAALNTPTDVATGVHPLGINATDSHFLYVLDGANNATMKAKPVGGGAEKDLFTDPEVAIIPPSGAGVVVGHDSKDLTVGSATVTVFSLSNVDMAGAKTLVSADIPADEWAFKDKKIVFSRLVLANGAPGAGTGLFVATLP